MKTYRPRSPLELMICGLVTEIYQERQTPMVKTITSLVLRDARFVALMARDTRVADRVMRYGVERPVRNVLTNIRFGGSGVYAGQRACLVVPVDGRQAGYLQFTDRLTEDELLRIVRRYDRIVAGNGLARDVAETMLADLRANNAANLEAIYGPMEITLAI